MKRVILLFAAAVLLVAPSARAFSLFGDDDSNTNKPPRLHILLQPANDLIEQAQMDELNGDPDKAIEHYQKAIAELEAVAKKYPERAQTAEFAPLRNKAAVCTTHIDAIRLEQVDANARAVAVTDTSALQVKYDLQHGVTNATGLAFLASSATTTASRAALGLSPKVTAAAAAAAGAKASAVARPYVEAAKDLVSQGRFPEASSNLVSALRAAPQDWDARFLMAYVDLARHDYAAADVLFTDLLADRPNDVSVLLLHAAALTATGDYGAAQKSLDAAIRANPHYYAGYYDMAFLLVEVNATGDFKVARRYYEIGRTVGGPRDLLLESKLGLTKK